MTIKYRKTFEPTNVEMPFTTGKGLVDRHIKYSSVNIEMVAPQKNL